MLSEASSAIYSYNRIPGLIATERGSLIRYFEARRERSDWAAIDVKVSRSTDGGESWCDVLLVEGEGKTLNNPVMFSLPEKIVFLFCVNYKEVWQCESLDDGATYTDPRRVNFEQGVDFFYNVVALGPGHGVVHNGNLIVPAWFAFNRENEKEHHPSFSTTFYSTDGGATWQVGEKIFPDIIEDGSECSIAVTAQNRLLISVRNIGKMKMRALAESANGFSDWHSLRFEENLKDPTCMAGMTSRDGIVYHSNCESQASRENLVIKASSDGFKSYRKISVSDVGGYSDIALLGDEICIFYEKPNDIGAFELYFKRLKM